MHLHRKISSLNGIGVLLILLVIYTSTVSSAVTQEEILDAIGEAGPKKYCGKKLTDAMKNFCTPFIRNLIMNQAPVKKSLDSASEFDFESFDLDRMVAENYEDDSLRNRYKIDDTYFSNDIPFMYSSQGNRRRRRGIIDECCKKACLKTDLIRYCPQKGG